jgi:hypothetical protein
MASVTLPTAATLEIQTGLKETPRASSYLNGRKIEQIASAELPALSSLNDEELQSKLSSLDNREILLTILKVSGFIGIVFVGVTATVLACAFLTPLAGLGVGYAALSLGSYLAKKGGQFCDDAQEKIENERDTIYTILSNKTSRNQGAPKEIPAQPVPRSVAVAVTQAAAEPVQQVPQSGTGAAMLSMPPQVDTPPTPTRIQAPKPPVRAQALEQPTRVPNITEAEKSQLTRLRDELTNPPDDLDWLDWKMQVNYTSGVINRYISESLITPAALEKAKRIFGTLDAICQDSEKYEKTGKRSFNELRGAYACPKNTDLAAVERRIPLLTATFIKAIDTLLELEKEGKDWEAFRNCIK